ncbi:MAG: hypothetical protein E7319_02650 [Clostridiales bacterium]|nr:hypothetical protein [Clostridiales bacterium]
MLVADILDGQLIRLKRYREGLRVFAALDEQKRISSQMIANACDSIGVFAEQAKAEGVEKIHLFATSAVRDASNEAEFAQAIFDHTGLRLYVCPGEEEAELSFVGATSAKPSGMIDIGGGSTEIVIGCGRSIDEAVSLQMGAVRLYRQMNICDETSARAVIQQAKSLLAPYVPAYTKKTQQEWVGVGGTFTTSAAFVQQVAWDDRSNIHGFQLSYNDVMTAINFLAPLSIDQRQQLKYLQPQRADIIVHGMAILAACMEELHIPVISVSEYGNLEGFLKKHYLYN